MFHYILRRSLQAVPLLLVISILSFGVMHLAPGGPLSGLRQNPKVKASDIERLERLYGLDQPAHIQYIKWVTATVSGDWGISYRTGRPVLHAIVERLPATLSLMGSAFILSLLIAIPVGILSAVYRYSFLDYAATIGSFMGIAIPTFWFGLMLQLLFSVKLGWLPSAGMMTIGAEFSIVDRLRYLLMPSLMLGVVSIAGWSRFIRSSMLDALVQDFVRTARAKGLSERIVILKHALRNALIPLVTIMGLQMPEWFGGAAITEKVFAWPGMGRLYVDSIFGRDYPILMGVLMFTAALVVLGNLLADIGYALLDPRIKYD